MHWQTKNPIAMRQNSKKGVPASKTEWRGLACFSVLRYAPHAETGNEKFKQNKSGLQKLFLCNRLVSICSASLVSD